jgi:hypothetical protein
VDAARGQEGEAETRMLRSRNGSGDAGDGSLVVVGVRVSAVVVRDL